MYIVSAFRDNQQLLYANTLDINKMNEIRTFYRISKI